MAKASIRKQWQIVLAAGDIRKITPDGETNMEERGFSISNEGVGDLLVGNVDTQLVPIAPNTERNYVDIEGGGVEARWDSDAIYVKSVSGTTVVIEAIGLG